jgi:hypothetical protein
MNKTTKTKEAEDTAPKEVTKDNGTQSFEGSKTEKVTAPVQIEGAAQMDNVDAPNQVFTDYIETPVVVREKRIIDENLNKENLKALIEKYKTTNPKKYKAKKEELERKLAAVGKDK